MPPFVRVLGFFFLFAIMGGVVYNQFRTTNKTVIGAGGRQVIVNADTPKQSLFNFGCANLQVEAYWRKQRLLPAFGTKGGKDANKNNTGVSN